MKQTKEIMLEVSLEPDEDGGVTVDVHCVMDEDITPNFVGEACSYLLFLVARMCGWSIQRAAERMEERALELEADGSGERSVQRRVGVRIYKVYEDGGQQR